MQRQKEHNELPPILMVEGNIGAGKSTFLKILQKNLNINAIFEPTNKWQSESSENNILHLFYNDTPRWAYTFQSYAFISRVETLLNHLRNQKSSMPQILERSIYCDRFCFAKNCFESGMMSKLEWQIYQEWFSWLSKHHTPMPTGFIYMKTDPETCYKRICKRNRSEETGVSLDYLRSIHRRHEDWLVLQKEVSEHLALVPTLIIDCNKEFETNSAEQNKHINAVKKFIDQEVLPFSIKQNSFDQTQVSL